MLEYWKAALLFLGELSNRLGAKAWVATIAVFTEALLVYLSFDCEAVVTNWNVLVGEIAIAVVAIVMFFTRLQETKLKQEVTNGVSEH